MKRKKQILTAVILSGSVGLGAHSLFAQGAPGSGQPGPTPQPRQTQPTIPGQPAPGLPQTEPMPGQPGTIPERVERPSAGDKGMVVSGDDIKKAKEALKAKGLNPGPIDGTLRYQDPTSPAGFSKSQQIAGDGSFGRPDRGKTRCDHGKGFYSGSRTWREFFTER